MTMRMKRTWRRYKWLYVMLLPGILYYLVFKFGPMFGLLAAFKEYQPMKGFFGSPWVGFKHFIRFFSGTRSPSRFYGCLELPHQGEGNIRKMEAGNGGEGDCENGFVGGGGRGVRP